MNLVIKCHTLYTLFTTNCSEWMDASIVIAVKLTKQPLWTFKRRYAVEYANVEAVCGGGPEFLSNCELDSARMFVQYLESRRWNSKGVEEAVGKLARKLCKLLDQENTDRKLVVFGFYRLLSKSQILCSSQRWSQFQLLTRIVGEAVPVENYRFFSLFTSKQCDR
jgi:hypothetical protein